MIFRTIVAGALLTASAIAHAAGDRFGPDDLERLAEVAEPTLSPDGQQFAYSVKITNAVADKRQSDLWRVNWDGGRRQPLTDTPDASEWLPQWSSDGRWLAFLPIAAGKMPRLRSGSCRPTAADYGDSLLNSPNSSCPENAVLQRWKSA